jgi:hypothetical protein
MVKFIPSPEQREVVAALSAARMPLQRIAASIINPRTRRAISEKTLRRMFKAQLDDGTAAIVEAYRGLREALADKQPWAIKYCLDHIAEFKAKEKDLSTPQAVKNEILQIHVTGVPAPDVPDDPMPPGNIIDALATHPMRQLPKYDAYPLGEPPESPAIPERPPEPPRTELDIEGALVPWYRKPITGHTIKRRNNGNSNCRKKLQRDAKGIGHLTRVSPDHRNTFANSTTNHNTHRRN